MSDLKNILDLFELEYQNCKFEGKELPKLSIVVDFKSKNIDEVKQEFLSLPAVVFNVSIISGSTYIRNAIPNIIASDISDENGWSFFSTIGCCGYMWEKKTVFIGYPYLYKYGADLPLKRAIVHELGHYKQDVLYKAHYISGNDDNNTILEYHNIMVNENKLCNIELTNEQSWHKGYRINYDLKAGPKALKGDERSASKILCDLLKKEFTEEIKLLLNRMLDIAKEIECQNVNSKEVITKLVHNMNNQLVDKV